MSLTIDKMFEYDLGIDYSDTYQEVLRMREKARKSFPPKYEEYKETQSKGFWGDLIAQDVLERSPPPAPPTPPPTRYVGRGGGFFE